MNFCGELFFWKIVMKIYLFHRFMTIYHTVFKIKKQSIVIIDLFCHIWSFVNLFVDQHNICRSLYKHLCFQSQRKQ